MTRLGIFGGSFDPVHSAHLLVAQAAREELALDRIIFVPAAQSPFKPHSTPASGKDRARLLRLALAGYPRYELDLQELERGGPSYTVDTVRSYARRDPSAKLFYLIGADHVASLPQWRSPDELSQMAEFVVIPRPGQPSAPIPPPFRGHHLRGFPLAVSSSTIRERIRQGLSIRTLVPAAVEEAIRNSKLYL